MIETNGPKKWFSHVRQYNFPDFFYGNTKTGFVADILHFQSRIVCLLVMSSFKAMARPYQRSQAGVENVQ